MKKSTGIVAAGMAAVILVGSAAALSGAGPETAMADAPVGSVPDWAQLWVRLRTAVDTAVLPVQQRFASDIAGVERRDGGWKRMPQAYGDPWHFIAAEPHEIPDAVHEPSHLVDLVRRAIRAHMETLGEIAWEYESHGQFGYRRLLRRADPGRQGDGSIYLPAVAGLSEIAVHFRGVIEYEDEQAAAVHVRFLYQPRRDLEPLEFRLLIPQVGARPSFVRPIEIDDGGRRVEKDRAYGHFPLLAPSRSVLQVRVAGEWAYLPARWQRDFE